MPRRPCHGAAAAAAPAAAGRSGGCGPRPGARRRPAAGDARGRPPPMGRLRRQQCGGGRRRAAAARQPPRRPRARIARSEPGGRAISRRARQCARGHGAMPLGRRGSAPRGARGRARRPRGCPCGRRRHCHARADGVPAVRPRPASGRPRAGERGCVRGRRGRRAVARRAPRPGGARA